MWIITINSNPGSGPEIGGLVKFVNGQGDAHRDGAVKLKPGHPGVNVLPDGKVALSARAIRTIARESKRAKRKEVKS
jgi:hypothetical protein